MTGTTIPAEREPLEFYAVCDTCGGRVPVSVDPGGRSITCRGCRSNADEDLRRLREGL